MQKNGIIKRVNLISGSEGITLIPISFSVLSKPCNIEGNATLEDDLIPAEKPDNNIYLCISSWFFGVETE